MIGIFDSGSGGLTFLAAMERRHPEWSYLYHADYANCPYWERPPEEIQSLTIAGVQKLFDAGASLVILACNTASAWTLRKLQTEIFPDKKILGVTIPGAEKVVELWLKNVTVFATEQTVKSRTYAERVRILDADTVVDEIAISGDLVREIEELLPVQRCNSEEDFQKLFSLYSSDGWDCDGGKWSELTRKYFLEQRAKSKEQKDGFINNSGSASLSKRESWIESVKNQHLWSLIFDLWSSPKAILLGCTHYSYIKKPLQALFQDSTIIDPSEEAAEKLGVYISKHDIPLASWGEIIFI